MRPPVRSLIGFAVLHAGFSVLVFLVFAGFFTAWDGRAVSVLERGPDQRVVRVLIVERRGSADGAPEWGGTRQVDWPVIAVDGLPLPIDARALPPLGEPTGPLTKKDRFTLGFTVTTDSGKVRSIPTPTPQAAAIALLVFVLGLGLRNMIVAGSPVALERPPVEPGQGSGPSATARPPEPSRAARGQKGPPPQRPRRGGGRRR